MKRKILISIFNIFILCAIFPYFTFAADEVNQDIQNLIDVLQKDLKLDGKIYIEDGAADGSIFWLQLQEIEVITKKGLSIIPVLISNLDNETITNVKFRGGYTAGKFVKVPFGYICLDILISMVEPIPPLFDNDLCGNGLQQNHCIVDGYYFRPDDYILLGNYLKPRHIISIVKKNWENAFKNNQVKLR